MVGPLGIAAQINLGEPRPFGAGTQSIPPFPIFGEPGIEPEISRSQSERDNRYATPRQRKGGTYLPRTSRRRRDRSGLPVYYGPILCLFYSKGDYKSKIFQNAENTI